MAWDTEMVEILRVMINDLDTPYKFTDDRLEKVILSAATLVTNDASGYFNFDYIVDIVASSFTPDPTDRVGGTRDDNFITLILLKAACFIDSCNARDAARKGGISIREWNTSLDTKGLFAAAQAILDGKHGWCQQYQDALWGHLSGASSAVGAGVFGPFRVIYNAYSSNPSYFNGGELFGGNRR